MKKQLLSMIMLCALLLTVNLFTGCGKKDATVGSGSTDSKKETTSGGNEIDGMIDQYEKIMNEYVVLVKKVKNGETGEVMKVQELTTKTTEWAKKLADMTPKMTTAQQERMSKISQQAGDAMK